jgi:hypothetical protein
MNGISSLPGRKAVIIFSNNVLSSKALSIGITSLLDLSISVYQCALPGWRFAKSDLPEATGELAIKTKDDSFPEIEQILKDLDQCYLLGYVSDDEGMGCQDQRLPMTIAPILHSLKVKVNRDGLKVRARSQFSEYPVSVRPMSLPMTPGDMGVTAVALPFLAPLKKALSVRCFTLMGKIFRSDMNGKKGLVSPK